MRIELATIVHLWTFLAARNWWPSEVEYHSLLAEVRAGRVFACLCGDEVVAIGGVSQRRLVYLHVPPDLGRRVLPLVLALRRFLSDLNCGVGCVVDDGNVAGWRLAALAGFSTTDHVASNYRLWWREGDDGSGREPGWTKAADGGDAA